MKTFYNLWGNYEGLRARRIARKGRLFLFKIFQEDNLPCAFFWLIYIADFDPKIAGRACQWFIRGTSIVSNACGKHHLSEQAARAHFEQLAPHFTELPKREVSPKALARLAEINARNARFRRLIRNTKVARPLEKEDAIRSGSRIAPEVVKIAADTTLARTVPEDGAAATTIGGCRDVAL
jgi:hypothetical protein